MKISNGIDSEGRVISAPSEGNSLSWRHWIGFSLILVGQFMSVLDIQIVASSLGELSASLGATIEEIAIIQSSYLIAEVIMIPLSAWLARLLSIRIMFSISATFFVITSVLCASAWNLESMTIFRAMQGLCAGALVPLSFATIFFMFPVNKQPIGVAIAGMITTTGITLGPVIGGWITQQFSWEWIFLINVVPGLIVVYGVYKLINLDHPQLQIFREVDVIGILSASIFLGGLIFLFDNGPENDWFQTIWMINLLIVVITAGLLFIWHELNCKHPMIDLKLLKDTTFASGCVCSFILGASIVGSSYLTPAMLSTVRRFNSEQIGTIMMYTGLAQVLFAPIGSYMVQNLSSRLVLLLGLIILVFSFLWHGQMNSEMSINELAIPQFLRGLGMMLCFMPITVTSISNIPLPQVRAASSIFTLFRSLGGAIGLSLVVTAQEIRFNYHNSRLTEQLKNGEENLSIWLYNIEQQLNTFGNYIADPEIASFKILNLLINREAWTLTFNDMWSGMALYCCLTLVFLPYLKKRNNN